MTRKKIVSLTNANPFGLVMAALHNEARR